MKIIATIGPGSNKKEILERLKDRGVDFFRINLSHTEEDEIEKRIEELKPYGVPIILDTEGNQVRSGNFSDIEFREGESVKIFNKEVNCDLSSIFLNPIDVVNNFRVGDLIAVDFNSVLLKVSDTSKLESENYIECRIVIGGLVGGKKAVQVDSPTFKLPPFSKKDLVAIDIAKKHKVNCFTLSFMESGDTVREFKSLYPDSIVYSKIESRKGLENFVDIVNGSDGILVDRGDLVKQVPIERLPIIQKYIINKCKKIGKEVFIATNTLEAMSSSLKPNAAEVNDVVNTILDGVSGFALTKEIAVGKYPIEAVNMIYNIINQINFLRSSNGDLDALNLMEIIEKKNYLVSEGVPQLLIEPHGGRLVDRRVSYSIEDIPNKKIEISEEDLMDVEQIAIGAFSPLEGFMNGDDFSSVVENMRLSNGVVWPLPIILSVDENMKNNLLIGEKVSLVYNGDSYAVLEVEDIYKVNKEIAAEKIYETKNMSHPGVRKFMSEKEYFVGGKVYLLKRKESPYKLYELTPRQTRKIFSERGWSKVLGFHTRNVIHRSHEFIQLEGLRKGFCDGLFVHPIIGKKKSGDFEADVIIKSYEEMMDKFYPKSKVFLSSFASYSRYAGPREAIFTALVRKNFGCSHFVVGRDHTGVGDFYGPHDSHNIFDKFTKEELGVIPIKFDKVFYSSERNSYFHESDDSDHLEEEKLHISGTKAREMLKSGEYPPDWFMRKEITEMILEKIRRGEKVFVD